MGKRIKKKSDNDYHQEIIVEDINRFEVGFILQGLKFNKCNLATKNLEKSS